MYLTGFLFVYFTKNLFITKVTSKMYPDFKGISKFLYLTSSLETSSGYLNSSLIYISLDVNFIILHLNSN